MTLQFFRSFSHKKLDLQISLLIVQISMVKFPDVYLLHIGLSKLPASQTNQMKSDPLKRRSLFSGSLREDYIVINQAIVDVYFTPRYLWGYFYTVCPRSSYPFCIVTYYKTRVTASWSYSIKNMFFDTFFLPGQIMVHVLDGNSNQDVHVLRAQEVVTHSMY